MTQKLGEHNLNAKQIEFCNLFISQDYLGHGTESYAEAYGCDLTDVRQYNTAKSQASKLLTKPNILEYLNKLIDVRLNDQFVDKQLGFLIAQKSDLSVTLGGIREYNKLKQRIQDKLEITHSVVTIKTGRKTPDMAQPEVDQLPGGDHRQSGEVHGDRGGDQDGEDV